MKHILNRARNAASLNNSLAQTGELSSRYCWQQGFVVCAFDAPAHGESPGEQSDVVAFGKTIGSVSAQLGKIDVLIGHSGGSAAALYAFAHGLEVEPGVHLSGPTSLMRMLLHVAHSARLSSARTDAFKSRFEEADGDAIEMQADGCVSVVFGSAVKHPHRLIIGDYSAHEPHRVRAL